MPDETMRAELAPCPFCGGGAWLEEYQERAGVRCEDCCNRTALHFTVKEAVAAWNRRASAAPGGEPVGWRSRWKGETDERGWVLSSTREASRPDREIEPLYAATSFGECQRALLRDVLATVEEAQTYTSAPNWSPSMTGELKALEVRIRAAISESEGSSNG